MLSIQCCLEYIVYRWLFTKAWWCLINTSLFPTEIWCTRWAIQSHHGLLVSLNRPLLLKKAVLKISIWKLLSWTLCMSNICDWWTMVPPDMSGEISFKWSGTTSFANKSQTHKLDNYKGPDPLLGTVNHQVHMKWISFNFFSCVT